jgi:oxygen-dependent protoporphyrinogen oxidase
MSTRPRVAVIGAGISGLTAAYRLHDSCDVTVFEARDRIGGQIQTEERGGLLLEWGPDSLVAHKPAGERLCRELGLGDRLLPVHSGGSRMQVVVNGKLRQLPEGFLMIAPTKLGPLLTTPVLSPAGLARAACERFIPARRGTDDESVEQFVTRRWGRELYERVAEPVIGGLFTGDAARLSASACIPRMHGLERKYGNVARGLKKMLAAHGATKGPRVAVWALDGGMGVMIDELAARLPAGSLLTGTRVRALQPLDHGWRVKIDGAEDFDADALVLACPAYTAAKLLGQIDPDYAAELDTLEYVSLATVNLLYDSAAVGEKLHGFGFFVARSEGSPLLACNYTSSKFEGRAPQGCVMLRAFLGGPGRQDINGLEGGELVRLAHEALARLLDLRGAPRFGRARLFPKALPHAVVGIEAKRERLAAGLPRLTLCGSARGSIGLPDCIESAEAAARRVLAETASGRRSEDTGTLDQEIERAG